MNTKKSWDSKQQLFLLIETKKQNPAPPPSTSNPKPSSFSDLNRASYHQDKENRLDFRYNYMQI